MFDILLLYIVFRCSIMRALSTIKAIVKMSSHHFIIELNRKNQKELFDPFSYAEYCKGSEIMNNTSIGLLQGIALYIAAILGSGVLFLSGVTASIAGPASILSWLIVILISFPLAYSFASLAGKYP